MGAGLVQVAQTAFQVTQALQQVGFAQGAVFSPKERQGGIVVGASLVQIPKRLSRSPGSSARWLRPGGRVQPDRAARRHRSGCGSGQRYPNGFPGRPGSEAGWLRNLRLSKSGSRYGLRKICFKTVLIDRVPIKNLIERQRGVKKGDGSLCLSIVKLLRGLAYVIE